MALESAQHEITVKELTLENMRLRTALRLIATGPKGVYSRDREQYLKSVIEWCQDTAKVALQD